MLVRRIADFFLPASPRQTRIYVSNKKNGVGNNPPELKLSSRQPFGIYSAWQMAIVRVPIRVCAIERLSMDTLTLIFDIIFFILQIIFFFV